MLSNFPEAVIASVDFDYILFARTATHIITKKNSFWCLLLREVIFFLKSEGIGQLCLCGSGIESEVTDKE